MIENLFALLLLLLMGGFWLNTLRSREAALIHAARACRDQGVQLLDQAVAQTGLGVRWTNSGIRMRRIYRFEFSDEGVGRYAGHLVLIGLRLDALDMDLPSPPLPPYVRTSDLNE